VDFDFEFQEYKDITEAVIFAEIMSKRANPGLG